MILTTSIVHVSLYMWVVLGPRLVGPARHGPKARQLIVLLQRISLFFIPQLCGLCSYGCKISLFYILHVFGPCLIWLFKSVLHHYTIFLRSCCARLAQRGEGVAQARLRCRAGPARARPQSGHTVIGLSQNGVPWTGLRASGHMAIYNSTSRDPIRTLRRCRSSLEQG